MVEPSKRRSPKVKEIPRVPTPIWARDAPPSFIAANKTSTQEKRKMASNEPSGDNRRFGAVRKRSQNSGSKNKLWTKRNKQTGKFMDQKKAGSKFKGVRK